MCVRRGEEQALTVGKKPPARSLSATVRNALEAGAIDPHHILLVAGVSLARRLEREPLTVAAEIRFGVLAAECHLPDGGEVALTGLRGDRLGPLCRRRLKRRA